MKFLIDMPLAPSLAQWLSAQGHDAIHVHAIGLATTSDQEILTKAYLENRIVVTADLDFPRLLALSGKTKPPIILFRGGNYSNKDVETLLGAVLEKVSENKLSSSITVVDKNRIRISSLPV